MVSMTARYVVGSARILRLYGSSLAQRGDHDGWRASKPQRPVLFDLFMVARFLQRLDPGTSLDPAGRFDRIASTNMCTCTCTEIVVRSRPTVGAMDGKLNATARRDQTSRLQKRVSLRLH